jgi:hypothetical protein
MNRGYPVIILSFTCAFTIQQGLYSLCTWLFIHWLQANGYILRRYFYAVSVFGISATLVYPLGPSN